MWICQPDRTTGASTIPVGQKKIILALSKNNKSHWHRRLDVFHVKDLEGKERCAANWKMTIRNLSALTDSAISCYPVVWLPLWKSSSGMVQAFYSRLLGRSWMKRAVKSLMWYLQLHSLHPSAWEQHWSLPKLLGRYACALTVYLAGPTMYLARLETYPVTVNLSARQWILVGVWLLLSFFRCSLPVLCSPLAPGFPCLVRASSSCCSGDKRARGIMKISPHL